MQRSAVVYAILQKLNSDPDDERCHRRHSFSLLPAARTIKNYHCLSCPSLT